MSRQADDAVEQVSELSGGAETEAFGWLQAKQTADSAVNARCKRHLSDVEMKVLWGAWHGHTYREMAAQHGYSAEYLNKDVGNKLWKKLSVALGEPVTKRNFRAALQRCWERPEMAETNSKADTAPAADRPFWRAPKSDAAATLPFPEGAVALDSPFYLERNGAEALCYKMVQQPGALVRIKAPRLMGKTSLINRVLAEANAKIGRAVYLDLSECDRPLLTDLDKFLRRFCLVVTQQLGLKNQLDERWNTAILGSNDNCSAYFEQYLLPEIEGPIVVGIDQSDRLFSYAEVAEDVLGMLRSWHEKAKVSTLWQRLRLVVAHSTETDSPLDMNASLFNAGVPIELSAFEAEQVFQLSALHGLTLSLPQIEELMAFVGGHPYLVRMALYKLRTGKVTLSELLKTAATEVSIYGAHLRRLLQMVLRSPDLTAALKTVVTAQTPVSLNAIDIYKLCNIGLVQPFNNAVKPSCRLYREYFSRVLQKH